MKRVLQSVIVIITIIMTIHATAIAATTDVQYLKAVPLSQQVRITPQSVKPGPIRLPVIAWGPDAATKLALDNGYFKEEGLNIELFHQDDLTKQIEMVLRGETAYLRGTLGMIIAASDALAVNGLELVVIVQLSWSTGGDGLVVRPDINNIADLSGKDIVAQLWGPHMDLLPTFLRDAKVPLVGVNFHWVKDLLYAGNATNIMDPTGAFVADESIEGVACIIPDCLRITSGGKEGKGGADSVRGAKTLLTTKDAPRIISDVYAVRRDYFEIHRDEAFKITHAQLRGQEALRDAIGSKDANRAKFSQFMNKAAELLLDGQEYASDLEGMLGDAELAGFDGNVRFFTGQNTDRNFSIMSDEIQGWFATMGLIGAKRKLYNASWDYSKFMEGLRYTSPTTKQTFDPAKVAAVVSKTLQAEPTKWEEGTLFIVEITFGPNQSSFPASQYETDFIRALQIAQTYGGALVAVEGYSDPLGILKARKESKNPAEITEMTQVAKNLSIQRAQAVKESFLDFARSKGIELDASHFTAIGRGIDNPKFNPPKTAEEWAANRRVVFRIRKVDAELEEFVRLD